MIILFVFLGQFVQAESLDRVRAGYDKFPVAECPEINKRYEEMTGKLSQLKVSIREKANCQDEKNSFDRFVKLTTDGREEFLKTTRKGMSKPLTDEEVQKVTGYIENLTAMGGALTDLVLGSSCFKDDNKSVITVELVATLINEATSALGKIKSSYGPLISLAGKISSTLIVSVDKIVRSRQAYNFSRPEDRRVFIQTMCSYAGFRREIDEISRVDAALRDVVELENAYQTQLNDIYKVCPECKSLADRFVADFHKGSEKYVRGPMDQIAEKYATEVKQADDRFLEPIGSQTVINLRSLVWSYDEMQRIDKNISDLGDVERDRVVQLQEVIEDFLFVKWHPLLLQFYSQELQNRTTRLRQTVMRYWARFGEVTTYQSWGMWWANSLPRTESMIDRLYSGPLNVRESGFSTRTELQVFAKASQAEINRQLGEIVSAIVLIERHCEFVRAANLKYDENFHSVCHSDEMTKAYDFLWALKQQASHRDSPLVGAVYDAPRITLVAWAEKRGVTLPRRDYVWTANPLQKMTLGMGEIHSKFPGFPLKK